MADEKILKLIEERLTRLEASIAAGGATFRVNPVVDPPPWGGGGGWGFHRWPIPSPVDPPPWGGGSWGGPRWPVPVPIPVDPPPWGGGYTGGFTTRPPIGGPIGDPPPFDLSRLNLAQLESSLHTINAEKARLESLESLVKDQIAKLNG